MKGKCNCRQVEFEIIGNLPKLYQCHCSLCRKQSGSSSNTATIIPADNIFWLSGKKHITSWKDSSGFRSDFCSICGFPVPNILKESEYYWVPAGLLKDFENEISVHLCVNSKATWDVINEAGKQYENVPEFAELLKMLRVGENT